MKARKVYLLTSNGSVHFIASNLLAVYDCIKAYEPQMGLVKLPSYSWLSGMFADRKDVAIPRKDGKAFTVSQRLLCSSFKNHAVRDLFI